MFNGSPLDKRPLWYSNPVGEKTPVVDEWGNETGETSQTWSTPAKLKLTFDTMNQIESILEDIETLAKTYVTFSGECMTGEGQYGF